MSTAGIRRNPYDKDKAINAPDLQTYRDARGLYASTIPDRKLIMFKAGGVLSGGNNMAPEYVSARMTTGDFFPMFETPFLYGGGWNAKADEGPEPVVVLSKETNQKAFGGANSVGKTLLWHDREFRVVGVLNDWEPAPKFYDVSNGSFDDPEEIYVPFTWGQIMELGSDGNTNCWKTEDIKSYQDFLNSECIWFESWVELRTPAKVAAYRKFLDDYVIDQKSKGRFPRPLNNHLYNIEGWMQRNQVVGTDNKAMLIMAFAFLAVCLVNTVGLLLAKFLNAAPIAGVRRALGASRRDIFLAAPHRVRCDRGGRRHRRWTAGRRRCLGAACLVWALRAGPRARAADRLQHVRDRGGHLARRGNHRRPLSGLAYRARGARLLPEGAIAMGLRPIFSALMRNGAGAILVAIQIALTLAIVVNAVFVTRAARQQDRQGFGDGRPEHVRGAGHELRKEPRLLRDGPRRHGDAARNAGRHRRRAHHPGSIVGWRQLDPVLFPARQEGREIAGGLLQHRRTRA